MKDLLTTLFKKSILLGNIEYTDLEKETGWIGNSPTTIEEIEKAEARLNVKFPEDYKEMLLIANGFKRCNDAVECDFIKIQNIDFFKNTHSEIVEIWLEEEELEDIGKQLERGILIGGIIGFQQFILIPPSEKNETWKYWKFAHWIPGEQEYEGLRKYIQDTIDFINQSI